MARLANASFEVRDRWWGEGTACTSDSKKVRSWESNLMTEWHARYGGGPGMMIYWHVERKSVCIYSQHKSCSSSEVAAMIEGLLRHCTDAEIEANYVAQDSRSCHQVTSVDERAGHAVNTSASTPGTAHRGRAYRHASASPEQVTATAA